MKAGISWITCLNAKAAQLCETWLKCLKLFSALMRGLCKTRFGTVPIALKPSNQYGTSIEALLKLCKQNIPALKENCWKFPKFHELLHVVDDIERFGAPRNFNAEQPESQLIYSAKHPDRRAQKKHAGCVY